MCFNPYMSGTFAIIGIIGTIIAWNNSFLHHQYTYILFAFYAFMEILQTIQYHYVNQCGTTINRILTEIAYLLVIVQPIMWNTIFYCRASKCNKKIFLVAIFTCIIWIFVNIASRIPQLIHYYGLSTDAMASKVTCTQQDDSKSLTSHLYWQWSMADFHGINANWLMYLCLWFIPCIVVGETRLMGIILLIAALFGALLTYKYGNGHPTFASTWCFVSIPMMCITLVDAFILNYSARV